MAKDTEVGVIDGDDAPDAEDLADDAEAGLEDLSDEELTDDDLLDDDSLVAEIGLDTDDDDDLEDGDDELVVDVDAVVVVPVATVVEAEEGAADEDEDELDDDDVEASLDVILKERLVVEDEDEPADAEDRGDGSLRVLPKQPGEFVCRSCFLVKSETQLADEARLLCRDCV